MARTVGTHEAKERRQMKTPRKCKLEESARTIRIACLREHLEINRMDVYALCVGILRHFARERKRREAEASLRRVKIWTAIDIKTAMVFCAHSPHRSDGWAIPGIRDVRAVLTYAVPTRRRGGRKAK